MTDEELIKHAAKAAGIEFFYVENIPSTLNNLKFQIPWNPLTDDGDALRLAVKLMLDVSCHESGAHVDGDRWEYHIEESSDAPYAATRRAIVRAAAEIGKGMKC